MYLFSHKIFPHDQCDIICLSSNIKNAKESRHHLEKISGDLDAALTRNSQVPKSRPAEAEDSQNILSATRSCFRHTALDHVRVLSLLQTRKRHEVLGTVCRFLKIYISSMNFQCL